MKTNIKVVYDFLQRKNKESQSLNMRYDADAKRLYSYGLCIAFNRAGKTFMRNCTARRIAGIEGDYYSQTTSRHAGILLEGFSDYYGNAAEGYNKINILSSRHFGLLQGMQAADIDAVTNHAETLGGAFSHV